MSKVTFGTKAATLEALCGVVKHAVVLPQYRFTVHQWQSVAGSLSALKNLPDWIDAPVIVRSSGLSEDSMLESLAGHYATIADVEGPEAIAEAVEKVVASFQNNDSDDQVFIQPMLRDVKISGVAFSRDPSNGGHYYVFNYDDTSGATDTVTGGGSNSLKVFYHAKSSTSPVSGWKGQLVALLCELEKLFEHDALDVEFALDSNEQLYLFQARPLVFPQQNSLNLEEQRVALAQIENRINSLAAPHPYLHGERSVFGVMPDWNPAEIIGVRPRPLAMSLYKELVTDNIWAYQRDNYGYKNLRSFPLLVNLGGVPFIDVRVSFNSFVPADIEDDLAQKLVNYYIQRLVETPSHHDKVEFEIIYSCYTIDLPSRLQKLTKYGFSVDDCQTLANSLRRLTNNIIRRDTGLWEKDSQKLEVLKERQDIVLSSSLQPVEKIYWLIEDCKRYGTLPFAGLARAGFIAVQLLRSLVADGVLSTQDFHGFMNSLDTVSSRMSTDLCQMSRTAFLEKYGHLRPGTYDILSPRYDEKPDLYFDWESVSEECARKVDSNFGFSLSTLNHLEKVLKEHSLEHDVLSLFNFIKGAIEGREYAKFIFTKSLSAVIELIKGVGGELNISPEELSYADAGVFKQLYASTGSVKECLQNSISEGEKSFRITKSIKLPPLITSPEEIFSFELPQNEPNFITQETVVGKVLDEHSERVFLRGNIVFIPSADPGYDWIFSHDIGGFVTMYGGVNSHMAIRAAELKIPAVIGVGEALFHEWEKAQMLQLDCAKCQVRILR